MDIEANCIVSSDNYQKFGISDRRRSSSARVQNFLDCDAVYQRYTERFLQTVAIATPNGPAVLENIREAFRHLQEGGTFSQEKFNQLISAKIPGLGLTEPEDSATILFEIVSWYSAFPFQASGVQHINENAFLRAVCLLTQNPAPHNGPKFTGAVHNVSSGTWGPHSGWFITARGKDVYDFNRWLLRSLAIPGGTSTTNETTIRVPRFIMYIPHQDPDDDLEQQVVVMEKESEQVVDILDVLAECPLERDRLTAKPLRESYGLVLSSLEHQTHDLTDLRVPAIKLMALLRLLEPVQDAEKQAAMVFLTEKLECGSDLSWESFNATVSKQAEIIANGLSKIFGIFKAPLEL